MEGPLLRLFFFLMASRGGSGQLLGKLCYLPLKGPESHLVAYYCPGLQDHPNARFCCGTCRRPFCCSSRQNSLDPTRCPAFNPVPSPTTSQIGEDGRLNVLWCFIGILVGTLIVWSLCRHYSVLKCPRFCGNHEEEEEEEVEMEERRFPVPPPPIILRPPSPPCYIDNPPPYSAIDPFASLTVSVTNASLRMGPTEGASRAQLRGAEGGVQLRGAEGGSPPRLRGAEGGVQLRGAEGGSPPRLRGAEGGVQLRGAEGGSPPRLRGAEGGVQLRGAEGGSPPRFRGAEGGSPPRLHGAQGGARSRLRGAEWGIPPGFREAEWGDPPPPYPDDPPPYSVIDPFASPNLPPPIASAPRRKRRAKAPRSVRWAPAEPAGTGGFAPAEASGATEGGVPAEPSGTEGGAFAM